MDVTITPVAIKIETEPTSSEISETTLTNVELKSVKNETLDAEEQHSPSEMEKATADVVTEGRDNTNPYAYLNRNEFSSENFKIEIKNLPKYFGAGQLKKFLKKLELNAHKIKLFNRFAFVCFRNESDREDAIKKIKGSKYKGNILDATYAKPMQDPLIKKRKLEAESQGEKRQKSDESVEDQVKKATVSFADEPYAKQMEIKKKEMHSVLAKLTHEIRKANFKIKPYIDKQIEANNGLICPFSDVVESPVTSKYRNKCEFTVGRHPETSDLTVGFRLSSYKKGSFSVGPINHLPHIPDAMKEAVSIFEEHFKSSGKDSFNPEDHSGVWRSVMIRTNLANEVMAVVVVHPQDFTADEMDEMKRDLKSLVEQKVGKVASLYFQAYGVKTSEEPPVEHLFGATHLREQLCGLEFSISPQAFFQINTLAAEVLYNNVAELAEIDTSTDVLDVCCGTGTIGLSLAKKSRRILGVELIPEAVEDAKKNAAKNNITNAVFEAGKAEDVLPNLIARINPESKVVAILDPPRAGLHQRCCQLLRKTDRIDRLVYVSCNASAAMKSFLDLCRAESNAFAGTPFIPTRALAVDLFPDTPHCELVLLLERCDQNMKTVSSE